MQRAVFQFIFRPRRIGVVSVPAIACALTFAASLAAQQVPTEPASTHIFPAGGRRGTVVPVRVGGEFLPPYTRFRMVGDGVTAPPEIVLAASSNYEPSPRRKPGGTPINYPREWQSEIRIDPQASLGQKLWRVSSARGGTGGRPFLVGDLPEFIETESNSVPERAESVALPVTINGQLAGERDLDYYRFHARSGDIVSIEVIAARLGSPVDPAIEITNDQGSRVALQELRIGSDPVIAFRVPSDGEYRILISNLDFHGGPQYVYRMTATTSPFIAFAFPPGGQAGTTVASELFALSGTGALTGDVETICCPADAPSVLPLMASRPYANAVMLETTQLPTQVEAEPNNLQEAATPIACPTMAYGRMHAGSDDDWYEFIAKQGQAISFECRCLPRGAGSLPVIAIFDKEGRPLARASGVELWPRPCRLEWTAPADEKYCVRVNDVRTSGNETAYSLSMQPAQADFALTAATDYANVVAGGRGELELKITRLGGFAAPIDLRVDGLPEGVHVEPLQIPAGQESFKLAFVANEDARPGDSRITITGSAPAGDRVIVHTVDALHLGCDLEGISVGSPATDHIQLTTRHKQVFRLFCSEAYQYACRGTIYPYEMEVERMNGFDGPIAIEMGDRQIMDLDGVQIVNMTVPGGTANFRLPLYLPEDMHINVQPHSNIYAQGVVVFQDKWGQRQSMLQVSEMRCMIRPLPAVARLRIYEKSLALRPGESANCTVYVDRTTNFAGAMQVELWKSDTKLDVQPVVIPAGQSSAVITIKAGELAPRSRRERLTFRGTGELLNGVTVVSEAAIDLVRQ